MFQAICSRAVKPQQASYKIDSNNPGTELPSTHHNASYPFFFSSSGAASDRGLNNMANVYFSYPSNRQGALRRGSVVGGRRIAARKAF
jgi:hypothetical protein